jgi:1-acyl-sn-glycerol-3-phosphate acyltransferase
MASETVPPKPVTEVWRPDLTRLPALTTARLLFRQALRLLARLLVVLLTRTRVSGLEHLQTGRPALIATNHLGDADAVVLLAALPISPEVLAKIEMLHFPVVGKIMDWYGMIWLHRGQPDRRAIQAALEAFEQGRSVAVAPEGRYTLARGLEPGGKGAAYLAVKARVPVIPVALTGTQNQNIYGSLRRLQRPRVTVTLGQPLVLAPLQADRQGLEEGTQRIMEAIAAMLPPEYRGAYR